MLFKNCCSGKDKEPATGVSVKVIVDVPRIVKSLCCAGVLIVGIIFGTKTFLKMLEDGFFYTGKQAQKKQ
jgi:hypothetical protein